MAEVRKENERVKEIGLKITVVPYLVLSQINMGNSR